MTDKVERYKQLGFPRKPTKNEIFCKVIDGHFVCSDEYLQKWYDNRLKKLKKMATEAIGKKLWIITLGKHDSVFAASLNGGYVFEMLIAELRQEFPDLPLIILTSEND